MPESLSDRGPISLAFQGGGDNTVNIAAGGLTPEMLAMRNAAIKKFGAGRNPNARPRSDLKAAPTSQTVDDKIPRASSPESGGYHEFLRLTNDGNSVVMRFTHYVNLSEKRMVLTADQRNALAQTAQSTLPEFKKNVQEYSLTVQELRAATDSAKKRLSIAEVSEVHPKRSHDEVESLSRALEKVELSIRTPVGNARRKLGTMIPKLGM